MEPLHIFVASSTEGISIARQLQNLLQTELGDTAMVQLWQNAFAYGETAIQSLHVVADIADFAVIVMTPDDMTISRQEKKVSPRDNLVFELGLFIGALGRVRNPFFLDRVSGFDWTVNPA